IFVEVSQFVLGLSPREKPPRGPAADQGSSLVAGAENRLCFVFLRAARRALAGSPVEGTGNWLCFFIREEHPARKCQGGHPGLSGSLGVWRDTVLALIDCELLESEKLEHSWSDRHVVGLPV